MRGIWIALLLLATANVAAEEVPHVTIGKFPQEVATAYTTEDGLPSNDVKAIHLDKNGSVWAETAKGWAVLRDGAWAAVEAPPLETLLGFVAAEEDESLETEVRQVAV